MPFDAEAFRNADKQDAPPDGHYDAELIDSTIITANADGRQWVKLTWKVLAGAQRDECWESWHTLDKYKPDGELNQPGLGITVATLRTIGVNTDDVGDELELTQAVRAFEGHAYDVEIKRKGMFVNTNVSHPLEYAAASLPSTGAGSSANANARPPSNAIYGGDGPAQPPQRESLTQAARATSEPQPTGQSDVTPEGAAERDFPPPDKPPQRGDIDPETGEPFPF